MMNIAKIRQTAKVALFHYRCCFSGFLSKMSKLLGSEQYFGSKIYNFEATDVVLCAYERGMPPLSAPAKKTNIMAMAE